MKVLNIMLRTCFLKHRHHLLPRQLKQVCALQTHFLEDSRTVDEIEFLHQRAQLLRGEGLQGLLERVKGKWSGRQRNWYTWVG